MLEDGAREHQRRHARPPTSLILRRSVSFAGPPPVEPGVARHDRGGQRLLEPRAAAADRGSHRPNRSSRGVSDLCGSGQRRLKQPGSRGTTQPPGRPGRSGSSLVPSTLAGSKRAPPSTSVESFASSPALCSRAAELATAAAGAIRDFVGGRSGPSRGRFLGPDQRMLASDCELSERSSGSGAS